MTQLRRSNVTRVVLLLLLYRAVMTLLLNTSGDDDCDDGRRKDVFAFRNIKSTAAQKSVAHFFLPAIFVYFQKIPAGYFYSVLDPK